MAVHDTNRDRGDKCRTPDTKNIMPPNTQDPPAPDETPERPPEVAPSKRKILVAAMVVFVALVAPKFRGQGGAAECPQLTAPSNGALSPRGANVVTFTCNSGYDLHGAADTTCEADGTWNNAVPTCAPTQCPALTAPTNGALSSTGANSFQNVVTFSCHVGYQLSGASSVTCQADTTWTNPVPTCTPTQCLLLTAPTNGALSPTGANAYQDTVTFTCNPGYQLNGASSVTCKADRTWTDPVPTCTRTHCPALTAPTNGALNPTGATAYQDRVTFTCNPGYQLNGASSVICQFDGTWNNPVPTCTPRQCSALAAPANGALTLPTGGTSYQDRVQFTCNPGYQLNGAASATCQSDGTWSHPIPTCTLVDIDTPIKKRLYGQPFARKVVVDAITKHVKSSSPHKALVLSFHGPRGVGKNYLSTMIAQALYADGMTSSCVRGYSATRHFKHHDQMNVRNYMDVLHEEIPSLVRRCPRALVIFDEMEKMPAQLIDTIKPFVEESEAVDGVDYRRAVFILLSNSAKEIIEEQTLLLRRDKKLQRENFRLKGFQKMIRDHALGVTSDKEGGKTNAAESSTKLPADGPNVCSRQIEHTCVEPYTESVLESCYIFSTCRVYRKAFRETPCQKTVYECCPGYRQTGAYCESGSGLWQAELLKHHLVNYLIPFLPLEREHVELCVRDALTDMGREKLAKDTVLVERIMSEFYFWPERGEVRFSEGGCRPVRDAIDLHIKP